VIRDEVPGLANTFYRYDGRGRLIETRVDPQTIAQEKSQIRTDNMTRTVRTGYPGETCAANQVYDCSGNICIDREIAEEYPDDGWCDNGDDDDFNLNCPTFDNDGGDCEPGIRCGEGTISDCRGSCSMHRRDVEALLGNGECNNERGLDLNCPTFDNDGGDCNTTGKSCGEDLVYDCAQNCLDIAKIAIFQADGVCDNGQGIDLSCSAFNEDGGDCQAEARITTFSYDPKSGYLNRITNALNHTEEFIRDKVGRVLMQKLPDGRQIEYEYDKNGNLTALKPPNRPEHNYVYNEVDLQTEYQAPDVGLPSHETLSSFNLDQQVTRITRPDNQVVDFNYDSGGRLTEMVLPKGTQIYTHHAKSGQVIRVTDEASGIILDYRYDGSLLLSETWKGDISGRVNYDYNDDLRVKSININGLANIDTRYDDDALITKVGDLKLLRARNNGQL
jgi:YD repeat-containing protein